MSLFKDVVTNIDNRRKRSIKGLHNSIPCPFSRLSKYYPGIEKGKYELVTASRKVGKSQLTDFMYVYHPVKFCMDTESDLNIKIEYLCLEMTPQQKMMQAMCHFLFIDSEGKVRISPKDLRSISKTLDSEIFELIVKYEPFFVKYLDYVHYVDGRRSVDEISEFVSGLCRQTEPHSQQITQVILDHASLIIPRRGQTLKQGIDEISANVFVRARNQYRLNPILIQQQSNEKESFEARRQGDYLPSFYGLADSKDTGRDIDIAFGLFSPEMAKMQVYGGIQVNNYGDNLRILNIIGGRENEGQKELPLYFDGAVSYFKEI